jgi:hypothetical protein
MTLYAADSYIFLPMTDKDRTFAAMTEFLEACKRKPNP